MNSRLGDFRNFVSRYPKVYDEVVNRTRSWQEIYEDWVILGERHPQWDKYRANGTNQREPNDVKYNQGPDPYYGNIPYEQQAPQQPATRQRQDFLNSDSVKNILGYLKKMDPDTISRTLNTVSKVLQITQGFGGGRAGINPNFNSWWD